VSKVQSNHFCAGIHFRRAEDGKYVILGVTAKRFPDEVKFPGGTNKNSPWENVDQTLIREITEETGLIPTLYLQIYTEGTGNHLKVFFVCLKVEGQFNGPKTVKEPDGDELTIRFWDLGDFSRHLFQNHRHAFLLVCRRLSVMDPDFYKHYPDICRELETLDR
jgi:8-oxo-dGTP pyrophosphatase MutT (NUDIX family)